jgi:CheY-like chemotaxis protein
MRAMAFTFTPTVLVIDDEPHIRRFVRAALEAEGCEVFEADRVDRGLIEAGTRQPDAVILDLGLPDGDGMSLIRDLRTWTEVPVLVLSARVDEQDKIAALDAGADDCCAAMPNAAKTAAASSASVMYRSTWRAAWSAAMANRYTSPPSNTVCWPCCSAGAARS